MPKEEAKRRYVARATEITGASTPGSPAGEVPTDSLTGPPDTQSYGGLRGDISAGTPYGEEDKLKDQQAK